MRRTACDGCGPADSAWPVSYTHLQIVSPLYEGHPGHPLLLASRLAPGILAYEGGDGLRGALRRFADRRVFLPVDDSGVLFNLAREADVAQQLERHNRARLYPDIKVRLMREQAFFGPGVAQLLTSVSYTHLFMIRCKALCKI